MKQTTQTFMLPVVLWINTLCDWDTSLAADLFMDAVETLNLMGKPLDKEAALKVVEYVANIIETETTPDFTATAGLELPPPALFPCSAFCRAVSFRGRGTSLKTHSGGRHCGKCPDIEKSRPAWLLSFVFLFSFCYLFLE